MGREDLLLSVTKKQRQFMEAASHEVLFGGAAGGGKSYGQLIDAFYYALRYPKSKQLILRRTLVELDKSLVRTSLGLFPKEVYTYSGAGHVGRFKNGSILDFGYCDSQNDVYRYQSAEYDMIRFDELTHFTEEMYLYLLSRLRGANPYPKQVKSTANPGGVGHRWVKARFVDPGPPNTPFSFPGGTREFIPSFARDNGFLMGADPGYLRRLENLPQREKKALLYGEWDLFEGQYFGEWDRSIHVIEPFFIPSHWRKYITIDYGLDMLAAYWIAVDERGRAWVYREVYQSDLIISDGAKVILEATGQEKITAALAPPDLWNRRQETGRSVADIFRECGLGLVKTSNRRLDGWLAVKEWLKPRLDEEGEKTPNLRIFSNCIHLIRTLPALQFDARNPNDVAQSPHELTHAPDALRGFCVTRTAPSPKGAEERRTLYHAFGIRPARSEALGRERTEVL
jgi:hypothetical protein